MHFIFDDATTFKCDKIWCNIFINSSRAVKFSYSSRANLYRTLPFCIVITVTDRKSRYFVNGACIDVERFSVKWRMSRSHDELLRPVYHESCCQRLPRRITKIRPSECLKFHTSTFSRRVAHMHFAAVMSCVSPTYLIAERRNGCRVDDSNLLSMQLNFSGPGHLLASRTRMISDRVRTDACLPPARKRLRLPQIDRV